MNLKVGSTIAIMSYERLQSALYSTKKTRKQRMSQGRMKNVNREVKLKKRQSKFLLRKISLRAAGCLSWPIGCLLSRESPKNRRNIHTRRSPRSKKK